MEQATYSKMCLGSYNIMASFTSWHHNHYSKYYTAHYSHYLKICYDLSCHVFLRIVRLWFKP